MENSTPKPPAVFAAISAVMKDLAAEGISKDRRNQQGAGYNFRGVDDVYNTLAPILSRHQLAILPRATERSQEERQTKAGGALFYTTVKMDFILACAVDGSTHTITTYGEAMDSSDKSTNKAMSAAFKYACFQAFCIPTEADNDADAHTPEPAAKKAASKKDEPVGTKVKPGEHVDPLASDDQKMDLAHYQLNNTTAAGVTKALEYYKIDPKTLKGLTQKQAATIIAKCENAIAEAKKAAGSTDQPATEE